MSDFCPCCDDLSIDSSRATRGLVEKPKTKKKPMDISVDKRVKKEKVDSNYKDLNKKESV
jgi:hypothetical protein